jgi:hypothetical protein
MHADVDHVLVIVEELESNGLASVVFPSTTGTKNKKQRSSWFGFPRLFLARRMKSATT